RNPLMQLAQRVAAPEPLGTHRYIDSNALASPAQHGARRVRLGTSDECCRLRVRKTGVEIAHPDARVDQHRDRARLEKREAEDEEIQVRRHHQCSPHAALYTGTLEAAGKAIAGFFQFAKRELFVGYPTTSVASLRA